MDKKERLKKQLDFIMEIDKVKNIFRQTYLADGCGAFLASGVDGSAFEGIFQCGSGSFKGDSYGTGA